MVQVNPPPPKGGVNPIHCALPAASRIVRIFNPERWGTLALTFRANGPRVRFDHHRGAGTERTPCDDPDRAVYYASWSDELSSAFGSALVELFGDTGIVNSGTLHVALPISTRMLKLLDLRDHGAMRAGTVAAIAKCEHMHSQAWSRYFYEGADHYQMIDGLIYRNAHNDGPAVVLYERASDGLTCGPDDVLRLDDPTLRAMLVAAMFQNNLSF